MSIFEGRAVSLLSAVTDVDRIETAPELFDDPRLPWWRASIRKPSLQSSHTGYILNEWALDWPFTAIGVGFELHEHEDGAVETAGTPVRLYWSGLIANVALFVSAWHLLLCSPGAARRTYRTWRHRCPSCGYDLQGSPTTVCSECGADQDVLFRQAAKWRKAHAVAGLAVLFLVAIPAAQAAHRTIEKRDRLIAGGWFDAVIGGDLDTISDDYPKFIRRVQSIPEHEQVLVDQMPRLTTEEWLNAVHFLSNLAMTEPRDSYLSVVDRFVSSSPQGEGWWAVTAYGAYPWDMISDRVMALLDDSQSNLEKRDVAVFFVVRSSWSAHPDEAHRDEMMEVIERTIAMAEPRTTLRIVSWMAHVDWIDPSDALHCLDEIVDNNPSLAEDVSYKELLDRIGQDNGKR